MAIEEPSYEVVERLGEVEIRAYAPALVAETEVEGEFERVGNQAFRRLAGYIFGGNRAIGGSAGGGGVGSTESAKIAMTAPVAMRPAESARIDMTAPVEMRPAGAPADTDRYAAGLGGDRPGSGRWVMSFTMPKAWTLATLPVPLDPLVRVRETPARTVAVRRFSGLWSAGRFAEQERQLRAGLADGRWRVVGAAQSLRYDPPWTPWFLRRNEVALPVEPATAGNPGGD